MIHAVVSILLLTGGASAAGPTAAAPVRILPREDAERDGRRTLGQFPKNLGRSFVGVFAKDNLFPALAGAAATGAAFGFDHGAQSAFGGRAPSLSAAASNNSIVLQNANRTCPCPRCRPSRSSGGTSRRSSSRPSPCC